MGLLRWAFWGFYLYGFRLLARTFGFFVCLVRLGFGAFWVLELFGFLGCFGFGLEALRFSEVWGFLFTDKNFFVWALALRFQGVVFLGIGFEI